MMKLILVALTVSLTAMGAARAQSAAPAPAQTYSLSGLLLEDMQTVGACFDEMKVKDANKNNLFVRVVAQFNQQNIDFTAAQGKAADDAKAKAKTAMRKEIEAEMAEEKTKADTAATPTPSASPVPEPAQTPKDAAPAPAAPSPTPSPNPTH